MVDIQGPTSPFESLVQKEEEKHWRPTPKQERFLKVPFEVEEAGYGGALGAGKTDILLLMPLVYGLHEYKGYKGLFFRRTFPELESEVIPRAREYFPSTGAVYNEVKHRWQFPKGGMDIFGHIQHEKNVKNYDTVQATIIRWDEATSFTGFIYEYLVLRRGRVPPGYPFPFISRWGSNPGNVGHVYFRKRFIDPCKAGGKLIKDPKTGAYRIFIPATSQDNKHLLEANPNYFKKLEGLSSEAERRAMILGDWYCFEGQVFDEFRLEPMGDEPPYARHVIEPFKIPSWWPRVMSIDWGQAAWTFVIWAAISPEGRVFIYRTYAEKGKKIKQWTREICLLSTADEKEAMRDIAICHSAVQDHGHEQTIFEQTAEALEEAGFTCTLTKGERARVAGKQLIHEYLRWKPLPSTKEIIGEYDQELAKRIERIHGPKRLDEYLSYFIPQEPEINLPKLQIFTHSPEGKEISELIDAIPSCVYDEVRKEDIKEFDGDDPIDCLRGLLFRVRDYLSDASDEATKHQKLGLAGKKLAETGDQTAFYRTCELAEAQSKKVISVRRQSPRLFGMSAMRSATRATGFRTSRKY